MRLTLIEGPAVTLECSTCLRVGTGGTEPFISASRGEERKPEEWYQNDFEMEDHRVYCSECAAKLNQEDPTRAVNQFFSDTAGNEILPENLPDF